LHYNYDDDNVSSRGCQSLSLPMVLCDTHSKVGNCEMNNDFKCNTKQVDNPASLPFQQLHKSDESVADRLLVDDHIVNSVRAGA
jgi:hypothetical protein